MLIYGHFEKAYGIAIALGEIDRDTWDVDYNYVRRIIHQAAYVAHRQDLLTEAANLEPLLRVPSTYEPQPLLMTGKALRLPFEKMDVWSSQPVDMSGTIASEALTDLAALSTMWLFGGSPEWPRERIDALHDSTVEQIKALPDWEQW